MDELVLAAEKAAKNAKTAMILTVIAVLVAAAVLAIDFTIKRAVLDAAADARKTLDDFSTRVDVMTYGRPEADPAGDLGDAGLSRGDGVHDDQPAGAVLDTPPGPRAAAPRKRTSRVAGGPQGDV